MATGLDGMWSAGAPTTAREGACAPQKPFPELHLIASRPVRDHVDSNTSNERYERPLIKLPVPGKTVASLLLEM